MYDQIIKINKVISLKEKRKLIYLAFVKFISGFTDMIGVASIVPFLAVVSNDELMHSNKYILDIKSYLNIDDDGIIFLFAIFSILLIVFNQIIRIVSLLFENHTTHNLWLSITTKLFKFYLKRPYTFHISTNSNQLLEKLSIQANSSVAGLIAPLFQILGNVFTFTFLVILLLIADPKVTLILLFIIGLFYLLFFSKLKKKIAVYGEFGPEFSAKTFKLSDQAFRSIKDIKVKNNYRYYIEIFNKLATRYARNSINFQFLINFPRSAMELFIYILGFAIIIYFLFFEIQQFKEIIVILGIYALALQKLLPATQNIFHQISQIKYYKHSFDKIYNDLKLAFKSEENVNEIENQTSYDKEKIFLDKINFKNIKFVYPGSKKIALTIKDLQIEKNKTYGVVGSTGSGKSTFIDILIGLLSPLEGEIKIDDINRDNFNLKNWTDKIGYVPQFAFMADDTIAKNIALGLDEKNFDLEKIRKVSNICRISDFIESELPNKYNTHIGEDGVRLSGGQRQRISIARALYNDPSIVILDESTNSLDFNTEKLILNNLLNQKNLTVIIISHRVSTLKSCDKIILLESGNIYAVDSYENLQKNNRIFQRLSEINEKK